MQNMTYRITGEGCVKADTWTPIMITVERVGENGAFTGVGIVDCDQLSGGSVSILRGNGRCGILRRNCVFIKSLSVRTGKNGRLEEI